MGSRAGRLEIRQEQATLGSSTFRRMAEEIIAPQFATDQFCECPGIARTTLLQARVGTAETGEMSFEGLHQEPAVGPRRCVGGDSSPGEPRHHPGGRRGVLNNWDFSRIHILEAEDRIFQGHQAQAWAFPADKGFAYGWEWRGSSGLCQYCSELDCHSHLSARASARGLQGSGCAGDL